MIVYITADGHIGNAGKNGGPVTAGLNERCRHSIAAFDHVNQLAHAEMKARTANGDFSVGAAHLHLGDLFDYVRVEPQVEAAVQESIEDVEGVEFGMIVGNHDQKSAAKGDHAMAPLAAVGVAIVETNPVWMELGMIQFLLIPFQEGNADDWLPKAIEQGFKDRPPGAGDELALCFHLGISDRETEYFLDGADDSVSLGLVSELVDKFGFSYVFAGNWHKHEWWSLGDANPDMCEVVQIGTLAPNRFCDTKGRFGCAARLDTETGELTIVDVPGPRFMKIEACDTFSAIENLKEFLDDPSHSDLRDIDLARPLYLSVTCPSADTEQAEEMIAAGSPECLRAHEVHADSKERQAAVTKAVQAAISATSKEEAMAGFIAATPLPENVDRNAVSNFVDSCVKEARQ